MNTEVQDAYRDWLRGEPSVDVSAPAIQALHPYIKPRTSNALYRLGLCKGDSISVGDLLNGLKFEDYRWKGFMSGFADLRNVGAASVRDLNDALVAVYGRGLHFNHHGGI